MLQQPPTDKSMRFRELLKEAGRLPLQVLLIFASSMAARRRIRRSFDSVAWLVAGSVYRHGPFTCTLRRLGDSGRWLIVVNDPRSRRELFRTVPVPTKTEAFRVAHDWCDVLSRQTILTSALVRNGRSFEAEGNVLRTRPSVS